MKRKTKVVENIAMEFWRWKVCFVKSLRLKKCCVRLLNLEVVCQVCGNRSWKASRNLESGKETGKVCVIKLIAKPKL